MPELPEVETVVRTLAPTVVGRRVTGVTVRDPRLRGGVAPGFAAALTGRRIERIARHGKYLLATLDDGRCWLVHLGMSGRLTLGAATAAIEKHDHVVVTFDDGRVLTYNDPRRFGRMAVLAVDAVRTEIGTGIDPIADGLAGPALFALTRKRKTSIKALLMDQRRVAGLGNIYVNEILFRARVRPGRRAAGLTRADCAAIVDATATVLAEAIDRGGSSINDYRDGLGRAGSFQLAHAVYDRAGEACVRCGARIRARVVVGRSTFYCPRCQR